MKYLALLLVFITSFSFGATGILTTDVFVYQGIGEDTPVINILPKDSFVKLLFARDDWAYIQYQNTKGNVKRAFIEVLDVHTMLIETEEDINLHRSASLESEAIRTLSFGDVIDIILPEDGFYFVQSDGFVGWVLEGDLFPHQAEEIDDTVELLDTEPPRMAAPLPPRPDDNLIDIVEGFDDTTEILADDDTSRLRRITPDQIFVEGEDPTDFYGEEARGAHLVDGIAHRSVRIEDDEYLTYHDYSQQFASPPTTAHHPSPTRVHIEEPTYSRAYSKYRNNIGLSFIAGTVFSNPVNLDDDDDFHDQILLYGISANTRISQTSTGRFGSDLRLGIYFSYDRYKEEGFLSEYRVNDLYYVVPISIGLSYDINNEIAVTGGLGVSALTHKKEYSFYGDGDWVSLVNKTYFAPNSYLEFCYELMPFVMTIGAQYFQWNSDNTRFDIDNVGRIISLQGELRRSFIGGYASIRLGF